MKIFTVLFIATTAATFAGEYGQTLQAPATRGPITVSASSGVAASTTSFSNPIIREVKAQAQPSVSGSAMRNSAARGVTPVSSK